MPLRWRRDEDDGEQKDTEGQAVRPRFRGGEDADEGTQDAEGHGFRIKREEDEGGEDTEGQGFRGRIREDESPDAQGGDRDGDTEGQGFRVRFRDDEQAEGPEAEHGEGEDTEGQGFRGHSRGEEKPEGTGGEDGGDDTEGQGRVWSDRRLKRNIGKAHGMDLQGL